jgi:hypothetical protein
MKIWTSKVNEREVHGLPDYLLRALFVLVLLPLGILLDLFLKLVGRQGCINFPEPDHLEFDLTADSFRRVAR